MTFKDKLADAIIREYGLSCTVKEFRAYADKHGGSAKTIAKDMKAEGLA